MQRRITHSIFYPFPPELVWKYLTEADLVAQWLMPNDIQPVLGHEFTFRTRPLPNFEFDGTIYCKILEVVPFSRLSYSWKGGPGGGRINLDSVVHWTLTATEKGTELILDHQGLMENAQIYASMNEGWRKNMNKVLDLLQTSSHAS